MSINRLEYHKLQLEELIVDLTREMAKASGAKSLVINDALSHLVKANVLLENESPPDLQMRLQLD